MRGPSIPTRLTLRGRSDLLEAVAVILASAAGGRGGALSLHGDVGVGKTALLEWAAANADADGFTVLSTGGSEQESGLPYAALHRLLAPVVDRIGDLPEQHADVVGRVLLTGTCAGDQAFALAAAVLGLLRVAAGRRPVLCCVDDTQWLDRPSKDVLAFAARRLHAEPVAVLFATRTAEPGTDPIPGVTSAGVFELDPDAGRRVVKDLVPEVAGDVAAALAVFSGGNPLALVELARSLTPEQRRGESAPPASLPADSALRRVLRDRLVDLPAATRWLLLLAAADLELDLGDLLRAGRACGTDMAALEPAERANLVHVQSATVTFTQPMLRSIVYEEAALVQRLEAHALLARILDPIEQPLRHRLHLAAVTEGHDPHLADALARAAAAAGTERSAASRALERAAELTDDPVVGATHLVAAARQAWEAGEPHRARILLRRVQTAAVPPHINAQSELLSGEIEMRAGDASHARHTLLAAVDDLGDDRQLTVSALMRASEALCLTGEFRRAGEVARRALALRRSGEPLGTRLLFEQFTGMTAMFRGDYHTGVTSLRRVLTLANDLNDAVALIRATMAAVVLGDDTHGHRLARRAVDVARATGDACSLPQALQAAGMAEFALGRYGAAEATLLEALPLARSSGQENLASNMLGTLAIIGAIAGDQETCLLRVKQARAHTATHGTTVAQVVTEWALAMLDMVNGLPAAALARLKTVVSGKSGNGHLIIQTAAMPHLVEVAMRCGDRETAERTLAMFGRWAANTRSPTWLALLARCQALVAQSEEEMEKYFEEALRQHRSGASEFEQARTEMLFGQELRRHRRPSAAREHLRQALETFQRQDLQPWIDQTTAELRAAGNQVGRRQVSAVEKLTPQQLEIARLAVGGATNREVANQLFLSVRTVDHHMRNIFARLGIRSRIELPKLID